MSEWNHQLRCSIKLKQKKKAFLSNNMANKSQNIDKTKIIHWLLSSHNIKYKSRIQQTSEDAHRRTKQPSAPTHNDYEHNTSDKTSEPQGERRFRQRRIQATSEDACRRTRQTSTPMQHLYEVCVFPRMFASRTHWVDWVSWSFHKTPARSVGGEAAATKISFQSIGNLQTSKL